MARSPLFALIAWILTLPANALPQDRELPLTVNADKALFDEASGRATYEGNVILTQGKLRIEADTLTAILVDGSVTEMMATGTPAGFSDVPTENQGQVTGTGNQIQWTLADETMTLNGDARLEQSTNVVIGDRVFYRQDKGTLEASGQGNERVQMTLTPGKSQQ